MARQRTEPMRPCRTESSVIGPQIAPPSAHPEPRCPSPRTTANSPVLSVGATERPLLDASAAFGDTRPQLAIFVSENVHSTCTGAGPPVTSRHPRCGHRPHARSSVRPNESLLVPPLDLSK